MFDIIIIGAGAAGLSAAIYTARRGLKTLILSKDLGGQAIRASLIENYPGYFKISGVELMQKFKKQAESYGVKFIFEEVKKIKKERENFWVYTSQNKYVASALILALGLTPRSLGIEGEEKFQGRGVSYCATCDAPLYKGKIVAVVGGGSSALDAALVLTKFAKKVYLIHRREEFRGEKILEEKVRENSQIELILNNKLNRVEGKRRVERIYLTDNYGEEKELKVDGLFIEIGYKVESDLTRGLVKLNNKGEIIVDKNGQTSEQGIFAAGDVTDSEFKQVIISAGEGAKAALSAFAYLQKRKGGLGIKIDWQKLNK